eukprot:scaffold135138_cov69-Phaeocystis_antarctica.AAC.2
MCLSPGRIAAESCEGAPGRGALALRACAPFRSCVFLSETGADSRKVTIALQLELQDNRVSFL